MTDPLRRLGAGATVGARPGPVRRAAGFHRTRPARHARVRASAGSVATPALRRTMKDTQIVSMREHVDQCVDAEQVDFARTRSLIRGCETPSILAAAACVSPRSSITF